MPQLIAKVKEGSPVLLKMGEPKSINLQMGTYLPSGAVTGVFKGGFATLASIPTASDTNNGDWAVLTADDGSNESGIYVKSSSGWDYVSDITTFDEAQALLATDAEFTAGTTTQKAVTVKQITDAFAGEITDAEAQADWDSIV